jgi:hypothetical protein
MDMIWISMWMLYIYIHIYTYIYILYLTFDGYHVISGSPTGSLFKPLGVGTNGQTQRGGAQGSEERWGLHQQAMGIFTMTYPLVI